VRSDVEFTSLGATLRGWLFEPSSGSAPAVVMAHGFSATRQMTIDKYAEALQSAGFAVLLYDHRGFGASDGYPSREVNPWVQTRGYLDATEFVMSLPQVDKSRVAVWGDSFSGSCACVAATIDKRIRAVVAQVPAFGEAPPPLDPGGTKFSALQDAILSPALLSFGRPSSEPMPVVSADPVRHPSALKPLSAFRWFVEYGGRIGSGWVNDVTVALSENPVPWLPGLCGSELKVPVLMIVSPEDEMLRANPSVARSVFDTIPAPKEWHAIGGGHFGLLYHPSELFEEAARVQASFLRRSLLGHSTAMPPAHSKENSDRKHALPAGAGRARRNHMRDEREASR
jgi:pimeloyl-ACP methyl ester carboxylesterase